LWKIEWEQPARKELHKLDKTAQKRIINYLEQRVLAAPHPRRIGEPLTGSFSGFWRYRIGEYRLICHFEDEKLIVAVIKVAHRRAVYH